MALRAARALPSSLVSFLAQPMLAALPFPLSSAVFDWSRACAPGEEQRAKKKNVLCSGIRGKNCERPAPAIQPRLTRARRSFVCLAGRARRMSAAS